MDLDALNRRFAMKGASFEHGLGDLPRLVISTPLVDAEIYVYGAHLTKFTPREGGGKPVLFVSKKAIFEEGKPIRGGVPICFPWFGPRASDPSLPAHGFARTRDWTVESVTSTSEGEVSATFALSADDETRKMWPFDFTARYTVTVGRELHMSLEANNTGAAAFGFEAALHTYFSIGDIHTVTVHGLDGVTYLDKVNAAKPTLQSGDIKFTGETDRVYQRTRATCRIDDPLNNRSIVVDKNGSNSTVVWNPWIAKSKTLNDFGSDEWPGMVCVETCNVADNAISLSPGASHQMSATIRTEAMKTHPAAG